VNTRSDTASALDVAARIGLLVPANNTTMHTELPAWLGAASSCQRTGIPRAPGLLTLADLPPYVDQAFSLARAFAAGGFDATVYGCTAAGILAGPERDAGIARELETITGLPTVTTAGAMLAWLRETGARRIALLTPYQDAVNAQLSEFLGSAGIEVGALWSFKAADVDALGRITAGQVGTAARALMAGEGRGCDALFIGCSQLPTQAVLAGLQAELPCPVSSSIHATAWQVAQRLRARVAA
jgi:maleate cis-trans isomerase